VEIPPFVDAVKAGVASVLVAHVRVPGMEAPSGDFPPSGKSPPASRSAAVVGFLRERVGFGGVVMSDDMEMGALLNEEGGVGQCAVDGLRASVDLFLACHAEKTQLAVVDALRDAIETDATNQTRRAATDAAARLRVLADAFVDGADAADLNARALETSDRAGTTCERVGAPEDARRVRDACGTSPRL
jgi:beta-N-acetylhexosaminidase